MFFASLRGYDRSWLRGDVIAGFTVWAVLVPEALAYAGIAGVSPVVGLYAAPAALVFYALLGSSRHLIVGPMSATAAISAATVADFVAKQGTSEWAAYSAAMAVMTGILAIVAGVVRLGFLSAFISEPVLKGFIVGLALTIMIGQVPALFGIEKGDGDFFEKLWDVLSNLGDTSGSTLLVGALSLAGVLLLKRVAPVVPASLAVVLLAIGAVALFDLQEHGVEIVGNIESGLPHVGFPDIGLGDFLDLAAGAVGLMLVGYAEGLGAAKTYADRNGYRVDPNRELLGLGAANFAAGFASGMVVNGSLSKTAVNGGAGAKSQVSGLVSAVLVIVTLLFLTGLFEELPEATLAAVVIAALIELVDIPALRRLYRVYSPRAGKAQGISARADFIAAVAALLGVLVFDTLPGLFIGIAISILLLLYRASRPRIATLGRAPDGSRYDDLAAHGDSESVPGLAILRPESPLFFANADAVRDAIETAATGDGVRGVVLDAQSMPAIDVTGAEMLLRLTSTLEQKGVQLLVAREIGQARDVLRRAAPEEPTLHLYPTVRAAVEAFER